MSVGEYPAYRARIETLAAIEAKLPATTGDALAALLFDRARLLTELGRQEEAKEVYIALLKTSPDHIGALNNLGALLHGLGYRTAAGTVYAEAVRRHPANPAALVNLANSLLADGDAVSARRHFEAALKVEPDHADAHKGYANALSAIGDEKLAAHHRRLGYRDSAVTILPYRGSVKPRRALMLIAANGGNVPIQRFLHEQIFETHVIAAEFLPDDAPLPPHDILMNAIGDADLAHDALDAAKKIVARSKARIINHPDKILPTRRIDIAERFHGKPNIRTPRIVLLPREKVTSSRLESLGFSLPFLLRAPGFHTGQHFLMVSSTVQLAAAVKEIPGSDILAIEYLDAAGIDGKIRKYRAMMIGGDIYPLHLAVSDDWKVHYFTAGMATDADRRMEDAAFLTNMAAAIGDKAMRALRLICDELAFDYGGIDFGLSPDGDLLLFEANATMVVNTPEPDPMWDFRRPAVRRIEEAVEKLLAG